MSNILTYNKLKKLVIKEMKQISLSQFGIGDSQDGASEREIEDAYKRYVVTTPRGKIEAKEHFQRMANCEDLVDEYDGEQIRQKYYKDWSYSDFVKLLKKIDNMENKV